MAHHSRRRGVPRGEGEGPIQTPRSGGQLTLRAVARLADACNIGSGDRAGRPPLAIDLIGEYQDAGIDLLIHSDWLNDAETCELFVSDGMPRFR